MKRRNAEMVIQPPTNDTALKEHRKTYHARRLFHLYAFFLTGTFDVAMKQGRQAVFTWDERTGDEHVVMVV